MASFSMAPYSFPPVLFLALSFLYIITTKSEKPRKAALYGFLFGLGYFGFSLSWIGNALLVEGNPYKWLWPLSIIGLPLILSPFIGLACYLYRLSLNRISLSSFILFVVILSLSDYARGHFFSGFPWNLYAYAWEAFPPIAQVSSLSDVYLLNILTIFWCSALGFLFLDVSTRQKNALILFIILSFGTFSYYGYYEHNNSHLASKARIRTIIVQPNIKQSEKWKPENRASNFEKLINLSRFFRNEEDVIPDITLIVWPETAISQDIMDSTNAMQLFQDMLGEYPENTYLITGALRYENDTENYYNSVITYNQQGDIIDVYNKHHLVPFGEYIPFDGFIKISPVVGFTGFAPGSGNKQIKLVDRFSFSPLICYEVIFPGKSYDKKVSRPDLLVNVTNDAWYGDSAGPRQHLVQTKFRAIETGIPIVRSANTGISAIFGSKGQNLKTLNLFSEGRIDAYIPARTFYPLKLPSFFVLTSLFLTLFVAVFRQQSAKP